MTGITPGLRQRLRAARRMLLGRGDDAEVCSFCGQDRHRAGWIVSGPGVAICGPCAHMALAFIGERGLAPAPPGMVAVGMAVIEAPACLLPQRRATLAGDLATAAGRAGCRLLGWTYGCDVEGGDYLFASLAVPSDMAGEAVVARVSAAMLGGDGAGTGQGTGRGRS